MSCIKSFEKIYITEEIWSPDIENALLEAIKIYPLNKKKIMLSNGRNYDTNRCYNFHFQIFINYTILCRNYLISLYIEKKTGKFRSHKQISSHIQVLHKRKDSTTVKILKNPSCDRLVGPKCLIEYNLKFSNSKICMNQPIFVSTDKILDGLRNDMPVRTISSQKLAFLAFFSYLFSPDNPLASTQLIALTTSVVETNLQSTHFNSIKHLYDERLTNLLNKTSVESFYVLKRWFDLRIPLEAYATDSYRNMCSSIFYSDKKLDIEVNITAYTFGKPVYSSVVKNFPYEEIVCGRKSYYVYHTTHSCAEFDRNLVLRMSELRKTHGDETVSVALKNYSILVYFKDEHTQEVLLAFIQTFDCSPNNAMYKFQKLCL